MLGLFRKWIYQVYYCGVVKPKETQREREGGKKKEREKKRYENKLRRKKKKKKRLDWTGPLASFWVEAVAASAHTNNTNLTTPTKNNIHNWNLTYGEVVRKSRYKTHLPTYINFLSHTKGNPD